jgi:hypothetical protein
MRPPPPVSADPHGNLELKVPTRNLQKRVEIGEKSMNKKTSKKKLKKTLENFSETFRKNYIRTSQQFLYKSTNAFRKVL